LVDVGVTTLAMKCDGLTDEELRQQSMPPSTLSLLGLVRHMADRGHAAGCVTGRDRIVDEALSVVGDYPSGEWAL
jgi:hypothetical protein